MSRDLLGNLPQEVAVSMGLGITYAAFAPIETLMRILGLSEQEANAFQATAVEDFGKLRQDIMRARGTA